MTVTRCVVLSWLLLLAGVAHAQSEPAMALNGFRHQLGLGVPRLDPDLSRSATNRAIELARLGELSHSDGQGRGPGLQMLGEGFAPGVFGEVLGAGPQFSSVWDAWLHSPTHYQVLADPAWTDWGWGSSVRDGTTVWVVRFRHP